MPVPVSSADDLHPGDYYEDCAYHPRLCVHVLVDEGQLEIHGISLVDGSYPRGCSVPGCGVRRLTFDEAMRWKFHGPDGVEIDRDRRWWTQWRGARD
jgi:hypothetical protein